MKDQFAMTEMTKEDVTAMILSLHSFTPALAAHPGQARPNSVEYTRPPDEDFLDMTCFRCQSSSAGNYPNREMGSIRGAVQKSTLSLGNLRTTIVPCPSSLAMLSSPP